MPGSPPTEDPKTIGRIIEYGKLKTVTGKRYPLSKIAEAHKYAEKGYAKGKVIINI
ncbi:MAG: zinc-binding dehydrogenase [Bacteroidales bacterium]|nr:MAG: zinc-binding dehydrogenase [Bacteroidales bacterium]